MTFEELLFGRSGDVDSYNPSFDTYLSPVDESLYRNWKNQYAPGYSDKDYDYRGAYAAGVMPEQPPLAGHWPDTYKKPNHSTFSTESQYAGAYPDRAGGWNANTYVPPPMPSPTPSDLPTPLDDPSSHGGAIIKAIVRHALGQAGPFPPASPNVTDFRRNPEEWLRQNLQPDEQSLSDVYQQMDLDLLNRMRTRMELEQNKPSPTPFPSPPDNTYIPRYVLPPSLNPISSSFLRMVNQEPPDPYSNWSFQRATENFPKQIPELYNAARQWAFPPDWSLQRATENFTKPLSPAVNWLGKEIMSGIMPDESVSAIRENPYSPEALAAYANAAIMLSRGAGGKGASEMPKGAIPLNTWQSWKVVKPGMIGGEGAIKVDHAGNHYQITGMHTAGGEHHIIAQPVEQPGYVWPLHENLPVKAEGADDPNFQKFLKEQYPEGTSGMFENPPTLPPGELSKGTPPSLNEPTLKVAWEWWDGLQKGDITREQYDAAMDAIREGKMPPLPKPYEPGTGFGSGLVRSEDLPPPSFPGSYSDWIKWKKGIDPSQGPPPPPPLRMFWKPPEELGPPPTEPPGMPGEEWKLPPGMTDWLSGGPLFPEEPPIPMQEWRKFWRPPEE